MVAPKIHLNFLVPAWHCRRQVLESLWQKMNHQKVPATLLFSTQNISALAEKKGQSPETSIKKGKTEKQSYRVA
ncbi:MAG: hypothetical protein B7C24_08745 [Bacteroidetes bacterium 4572_77]|nr:MAG: hypothetical protein B7C24_08745 [Bacteroidetes bacterium 4572_77]